MGLEGSNMAVGGSKCHWGFKNDVKPLKSGIRRKLEA